MCALTHKHIFYAGCSRSAHRDCLKGVDRCTTMQPQRKSRVLYLHVILFDYYCAASQYTSVPPTSLHRPITASLSTGASIRPPRRLPSAMANATESIKGKLPLQVCLCGKLCICASLLGSAGHIFIAKERYDAIGSRSNRVLSFERGEELEVFNPLPTAEWWEASFLTHSPSPKRMKIDNFIWSF